LIHQYPYCRENSGHALGFIYDDKFVMILLQSKNRIFKRKLIRLVFKIEKMDCSVLDELAGKGCFSTLPWPDDRCNWRFSQCFFKSFVKLSQ